LFATFHACTVIIEACAGSHHMASKLAAFGHTVKLISPQFVRPFVKSNKNDRMRSINDVYPVTL
jgi:transposase